MTHPQSTNLPQSVNFHTTHQPNGNLRTQRQKFYPDLPHQLVPGGAIPPALLLAVLLFRPPYGISHPHRLARSTPIRHAVHDHPASRPRHPCSRRSTPRPLLRIPYLLPLHLRATLPSHYYPHTFPSHRPKRISSSLPIWCGSGLMRTGTPPRTFACPHKHRTTIRQPDPVRPRTV